MPDSKNLSTSNIPAEAKRAPASSNADGKGVGQRRWMFTPNGYDEVEIARQWCVEPLIAKLLLNRGLTPDDDPAGFLAPPLAALCPPDMLPGATDAARLIMEAARAKTPIVLYGDYDVDGTTGIAILWHMLTAAGAKVSYYVPHRTEEGYGLNLAAVRTLVDDGAKLIISIDCGISDVKVADYLHGVGVPLIVTDHHQPPETLPNARVIVHPGLDDRYPNPHLCGAGVAFKLAWALSREICGSDKVTPELRDVIMHLLPFAALGTIADVVPLHGENRVIARYGLEGLRRTPFVGLRALIEQARLTSAKITGTDVGFRLAPRINAAGRMGHARLAVELFTRADEARAVEIAKYLESQNRTRQNTERSILKAACLQVDELGLASDAKRGMVLAAEGWHPGVIGIVASRLVDRYHRPAIMIALSNGQGQGSGRSISAFDLHAALTDCSSHLTGFGGHKMAAGLKIETNAIDAFREAFVAVANNRLTGDDLRPKLKLDAIVPLDDLDMGTVETIRGLGPFGIGNPKPKLASDWLDLADEPRCVGRDGSHLSAAFMQNGRRIRAIGFGMAAAIEDLKQHRRCRVAFEPIINEFNGRRSVEMQLIDMRFTDEND